MESCDSSNPEFRISLIHFHIGVVIHAPVWGATHYIDDDLDKFVVSIHAPVWGATPAITGRTTSRICFNPRTRVGCDNRQKDNWRDKQVSIHAPVWGATKIILKCLVTECFNPRTRVGCDNTLLLSPWIDNGFNPRTRVGCDP